MLNIGICDSNAAQREQLHKVLTMLLFDTIEIKVHHYPDAKTLLKQIETKTLLVDLLFMEVALPDASGMKVAATLRAAGCKTDLIFLTELERYVFDGYIYHAYDYLLKPVSAKKLGACLHRYVSEHFGEQGACLVIRSKGETTRLDLGKVCYFESRQRKVAAVMDGKEVEFYHKMGDLFETVRKSGFVRCHQSYVVNASQIAVLHRHDLVLSDGRQLPISKRYLSEIRELVLHESERELVI